MLVGPAGLRVDVALKYLLPRLTLSWAEADPSFSQCCPAAPGLTDWWGHEPSVAPTPRTHGPVIEVGLLLRLAEEISRSCRS